MWLILLSGRTEMDRDTEVYFIGDEAAGTWSWLLFAAEVKNECSYTSTPPYISVATHLTKHRDKYVLISSLYLGWSWGITLWPAVDTAFTSHADRQFETSARRLLLTLTGSSTLQHGVYFLRWPGVRNVGTAFTSHADRLFETSTWRLLLTLIGSSKRQPTRQIRATKSQTEL